MICEDLIVIVSVVCILMGGFFGDFKDVNVVIFGVVVVCVVVEWVCL